MFNNKLPQGFEDILGTTEVGGEIFPNARVNLYSKQLGNLLHSTVSNDRGQYKFTGVCKGKTYVVTAIDPLNIYNSISQDIKI